MGGYSYDIRMIVELSEPYHPFHCAPSQLSILQSNTFQVRGNPNDGEGDPTGSRGEGGSEFRVIQTNPRFNKNPFKRPEGALVGGREGAVDLDKLFPEGNIS